MVARGSCTYAGGGGFARHLGGASSDALSGITSTFTLDLLRQGQGRERAVRDRVHAELVEFGLSDPRVFAEVLWPIGPEQLISQLSVVVPAELVVPLVRDLEALLARANRAIRVANSLHISP